MTISRGFQQSSLTHATRQQADGGLHCLANRGIMAEPFDIMLTPVGSAGDNFPFIGLGAELARRGHRVSVVTSDHYASLCAACGVELISIGTEEEFRKIISNPEIWHPTRGFATVLSMIGEQNARVFEVVAKRREANPGSTVVVAHTLDFASRALSEKFAMPLVTAHLQPSIMRTVHELPTMNGRANYSWLPRWVKRVVWRMADRMMLDKHAGPVANAMREKVGLGPVKRIFRDYIHSPLLSLGLWPEWFAAAQPDYPPQFKLTGFPLFDANSAEAVAADVLAFMDAGDAPIVFTPGSANVHAGEFFQASVEALRQIKRRGMLLTRHAEQVPGNLPEGVAHFPFAPLSRILSQCAGLVHHGGIGTTAAALAAGIPQVIMPLSHDQPDNAARVEELGVGASLFPKAFTGPRLAKVLAKLLADPAVRTAGAKCATLSLSETGLPQAANLIEQTFENQRINGRLV